MKHSVLKFMPVFRDFRFSIFDFRFAQRAV